jgi:hypothetical protein
MKFSNKLSRITFFFTSLLLIVTGCGGSNSTSAPRSVTYTAILLQPTRGYIASETNGLLGDTQFGRFTPLSETGKSFPSRHAALWRGTPNSVVDMHPTGYDSSNISGISGNTQVGSVSPKNSQPHAALWRGTPDSVVDMHPTGYDSSYVSGISGNTQAGVAIVHSYADGVGNYPHGVIWRGNANNFMDIHPDGYSESVINGISRDMEVGAGRPNKDEPDYTSVLPSYHALLWKGATKEVVDLNPAGYASSEAIAVSGDTQVGGAWTKVASLYHAILWKGSAENAVDLHPAGYRFSQATGVSNDIQVGRVSLNQPNDSLTHAMLWRGTAESAIDLHSTTLGLMLNGVPINPVSSSASAVDSDGNIVGVVIDKDNNPYAVMWQKN